MKSKFFVALFAVLLIAAACNKGTQQTTSNNTQADGTTSQESGDVATPTPTDDTGTQTPNTPTQTPSSNPTSNSVQSTNAVVHMTSSGFSPASLTVKAGTKVTFVNDGTIQHWPASNPHPTHTDLPGFDAGHALSAGETYSFTFTKVGTWGYHNHLNPSTKGTIIVTK